MSIPEAIQAALDDSLKEQFSPLSKGAGGKFPGAAVALVYESRAYFSAVGLADIEGNTPLTATSVFDLASCSKNFAALAAHISIYNSGGKYSLHDPVHKFLPSFPSYKSLGHAKRDITVHDLIHHTSGLPDYTSWYDNCWNNAELLEYFCSLAEKCLSSSSGPCNNKKGKQRDEDDDEDEVDEFDRVALRFEPGEHFNYSNTNYALLPLIVEAVNGGIPYSTYLTKTIFEPLKMTRTRVFDELWDYSDRDSGPRGQEGIVTGYEVVKDDHSCGKKKASRRANKHKNKRTGGVGGAGGGDDADFCFEVCEADVIMQGDGNVFSCAEDLCKYEAAIRQGLGKALKLGSGYPDKDLAYQMVVLQNGTLASCASDFEFKEDEDAAEDEERRVYAPTHGDKEPFLYHASPDEDSGGYTFGWEVSILATDGIMNQEHSGAWAGTSTYLWLSMNTDMSIVVLSNGGEDSPVGAANEIGDKVIEAVFEAINNAFADEGGCDE